MSEPRLALLRPADLSGAQQELYDELCSGPRADAGRPAGPVDAEGRLTGPFNAMLLSPAVGAPLQRLGAALRYASDLDPVVRELAILAVAAHHDSAYERAAHRRVATRLGISGTALDAVEAGEVPAEHPEAAPALELVRRLLSADLPDDAAYDRLRTALGEAGLFEVSTLVGYYSTVATQLALFGVTPGGSR
ncbi:carboxymuconolactone decarboxylase family protein [Nocardioides sp.]|uniref:carboxymuconolactone decarboxylase family protein n=1 Tax=Nocardioides sp. TaxID=35761 RepID=UPI0026373FC1|nr:carboxymuconolactone decarboxylase family protein [Nocardioides sp.]